MLQLHNLKLNKGAHKRRKVVGRGLASGHGTFSTRGAKGQKARTGHSKLPARFEGGRQPLVRQLPKSRGFKSLAQAAVPVNLGQLGKLAPDTVVTLAVLKTAGLVRKDAVLAKVVSGGELKVKLTVKLPASASAKAAIEKAGGQVV